MPSLPIGLVVEWLTWDQEFPGLSPIVCLFHPDDTSMRITADDTNFVTNPERVYIQ